METLLKESASCKSFHFMKDTYTKTKTLNALGQKHQVVHDHYSFWNLKTTVSLMEVQLFRTCPRGNGGNPGSLAFWSLTLTMSILKLSNSLSTSRSISLSLFQIVSGSMKPVERKYNSTVVPPFLRSLSLLPEKADDSPLYFFFDESLPL